MVYLKIGGLLFYERLVIWRVWDVLLFFLFLQLWEINIKVKIGRIIIKCIADVIF